METVEWYTPQEFIEAARAAMGSIDLDPASNDTAQYTVQASNYYTVQDNGLAHAWRGNVWLNPPYGKHDDGRSAVGVWAHKLRTEYEAGRTEQAVFLCGTRHSEQAEVQRLMRQGAVCITRQRIRFHTERGAQPMRPTGNNLFIYLGHRKTEFARAFTQYGVVLKAGNL